MKLWTMTWMAFVMVFCFAIAAYADPVGEDKTEMAKAQAIAEAEAKLQPREANIKTIFDEALKDRQLKYAEMMNLDAAIERHEQDLKAVNQHLAIYKTTRGPRVYLPALTLHGLYFQKPAYGKINQDKMRLLAAGEGVDLQEIETQIALVPFLILSVIFIFGGLCLWHGSKNDKTGFAFFGIALLIVFVILLITVLV